MGTTSVSAREGYALWAETWDATPSPIVALEERMLLPWLGRVGARRAVDIGCGTGRWSERLGAIGVDASEAMLRHAAQKSGLGGRLAAGDAALLPIRDGTADLVLCTLTLGHVRRPEDALLEFARILQPGGQLVMSDFHPDAIQGGWQRTFRRDGRVYELETFPYAIEELAAAVADLLVCVDVAEASIGEPERAVFERAGRPELFEAACSRPVLLLSRWQRL